MAHTPDNSAKTVIASLGGCRSVAAQLGVDVTTVRRWRQKGVIPEAYRGQLLSHAERVGVSLAYSDFQPGTV